MKLIFSILILFSLNALADVTPLRNVDTYMIKKGDQLMKISKLIYGTTKRWHEIAQLNSSINPNCLKVGTLIVIPALEKDIKPFIIHKVQRGEQLMKISYKYYGTHQRWQEIVDVNPGIKPSNIEVGDKIIIPRKIPLRSLASDGFDMDKFLRKMGFS